MNQNNEDRQLSVFEIDANDDETDVVFLEQAYAYHQHNWFARNIIYHLPEPINRDREGAEERLMADYFNDHCAAIRQLAYGTTPDAFDEYLQMSERTARNCLFHFNKCIISLYMVEYLRKPTVEDVENIYNKHLTTHGFPGMLGSIDCMHWEWKNCPVSWQGQYGRGDKKYPTIMLEVVASQDLWIWHAFFGVAGYYLADGIYPQWATFVKSFTVANDAKHAYFKKRQEGARKDVERAFGVLQGRWGIIQQPARSYHVNTLHSFDEFLPKKVRDRFAWVKRQSVIDKATYCHDTTSLAPFVSANEDLMKLKQEVASLLRLS
ncbi:nucleotide-binding alpha-beta plait domain-containing protein [Tanacetum coccineum]